MEFKIRVVRKDKVLNMFSHIALRMCYYYDGKCVMCAFVGDEAKQNDYTKGIRYSNTSSVYLDDTRIHTMMLPSGNMLPKIP